MKISRGAKCPIELYLLTYEQFKEILYVILILTKASAFVFSKVRDHRVLCSEWPPVFLCSEWPPVFCRRERSLGIRNRSLTVKNVRLAGLRIIL